MTPREGALRLLERQPIQPKQDRYDPGSDKPYNGRDCQPITDLDSTA
jgi:hypothetical protein